MLSLVLFTPFLSALVLIILGNIFSFRIKLENKVSYVISCIPAGLSAIISMWAWVTQLENQNFSLSGPYWFKWFNSEIFWEENINSLTINMLLLVNLVGFVVLTFSPIYMYEERNITTFFAYVYLFIGFMNLLLFANNLFQLFVGWEGIGICSFLLIGFWGGRFSASKAAFYAMLINKIGDITLLLGAVLVMFNTSHYSFEYTSNEVVNTMYITNDVHYQKIIFGLLLVSTFCKSAQIVFHGWLPEAMEGPTPVSALIHAATMVTAGNYLVVKLSSNWVHSTSECYVLITFGAFTCLYASIIAFYQVDIKRVVAYSTCSQLGYMVLACGLSMYEESLTHCLSHGFFKALLFLASGWVIYVYGHEQSSLKMGGRGIFSMELVYFVIGSGSLVALPLSSGWYSKEAIIFGCVSKNMCMMLGFAVWVAAVLTSLYSAKVIYNVFFSSAKESGVGGENLAINNLESRNKWVKGYIFAVALSLFLLVNFSLFFGYINSARNLSINTNHANLTSIEIFSLCIYFFLLGIGLRTLEFLLKISVILDKISRMPRFLVKSKRDAENWHEEKMMSVRKIRTNNFFKRPGPSFWSEHWYYIPSWIKFVRLWAYDRKIERSKKKRTTWIDALEETFHFSNYTSTNYIVDWESFKREMMFRMYKILHGILWVRVFIWLYKYKVFWRTYQSIRLIFRFTLKFGSIYMICDYLGLLFLPIVCLIFSYKICSIQALIAFSKALHFSHIKARFWNSLLVFITWYNERFEPACYLLVHIILAAKLNLVKKLSKFLRNNITGWALFAFLVIILIIIGNLLSIITIN